MLIFAKYRYRLYASEVIPVVNVILCLLALGYSFLINFVTASKTVKFILQDFVLLQSYGTFLVVATVDSGLQKM